MNQDQLIELAKNAYSQESFEVNLLNVLNVDKNVYSCSFEGICLKHSFTLDFNNRFSYDCNIFVEPFFRGKGYGRDLVEAREKLCIDSGMKLILIHKNKNDDFWNHMGYELANQDEIERFREILNNKITFYMPTRYKLIA
jgi:GNAT superfamily N-acetyltransferase